MLQSPQFLSMKPTTLINVLVFTLLLIVGILTLSAFHQFGSSSQEAIRTSPPVQVTPTPLGGDQTEVGKTDGIVVMGILIVLIIITPVVVYTRRKRPTGRSNPGSGLS